MIQKYNFFYPQIFLIELQHLQALQLILKKTFLQQKQKKYTARNKLNQGLSFSFQI